jgi:acyl-CoA synthetase (AMP-forming)/AMP-acid ligase II
VIDSSEIAYLADIPGAHARIRGDQPAVICEGRTTTFSELNRRSNQVAQALRDFGARTGSRVCVLTDNCEQFTELFFGTVKARACLVPINTRLSAAEVSRILGDAAPLILFVGEGRFELAERAVEGASPQPRLIALTGTRDGFTKFVTWAGTARPDDPELDQQPDDDVLQLYTSGTTGQPKGVVLTNLNYRRFMEMSVQLDGFDYETGATVMNVMPLFHVAGVNVSLMALAHGCRLVLVRNFDAVQVVRMIAAERVADIFVVPSMLLMLLQTPEIEHTNLASLRTVAYGASPIAESVLLRAKTVLGCRFAQFYGMTESLGVGTCLSAPAHGYPDKLRSCGVPWPGVQIDIRRSDGTQAEPGEVGEIAIRSETVMKGYWNRHEETVAALCDGWLLTGDAGYKDPDGYVFIQDRIKDMIVSGGENVYPSEVENALYGCPGISEVAIIGVPSDRWGEEVKAVVVPSAGATADAAAIIAWAKVRIAPYKAPKSVDFVAALPRNPSGKVLRRELRKAYWASRDRNIG